MKILCIDDEPFVLDLMVRFMPSHDVTCYADSCAAISHLTGREEPVYDVIMCDLMMPDCSGVDVHRAVVRRRPELALRMVFFTGVKMMPGIDAFLDSVPNPRFEKPFGREELIAAITKVST